VSTLLNHDYRTHYLRTTDSGSQELVLANFAYRTGTYYKVDRLQTSCGQIERQIFGKM